MTLPSRKPSAAFSGPLPARDRPITPGCPTSAELRILTTVSRDRTMSSQRKTAIVTGAAQGIGAAIVKAFVERGFNVVASSRRVTQSTEVAASDHVALVDGHIGEPATAAKIVETALSRFKSIDALVNNAGIFFTKPFTEYTAEDFRSLVSTNLEGFLYVTQLSIQEMLAQ